MEVEDILVHVVNDGLREGEVVFDASAAEEVEDEKPELGHEGRKVLRRERFLREVMHANLVEKVAVRREGVEEVRVVPRLGIDYFAKMPSRR